MSEKRESTGWRRRPYSIFGPLLLIAVGVVFLLKTLGIIEGNLWDLFLKTWPVLFIVSGLDGLYRGDGYVGGVVWTGLGVILLLGNLGYIQIAPWNAILRLWPFILVVWGLDILFHRRTWWSAGIGIVIGFGVLAVMLWILAAAPIVTVGEMQTFETPVEGASQAAVLVEPVTGKLWVGAGAQPSNLVEAEIALLTNEEIERDYDVQDSMGDYRLRSGSLWFGGQTIGREWRVKLNTRLPLDVTTRVIVGEQTVNFSGLDIKNTLQETIFGKTTLYLPQDEDGEVETSVIFGEMLVYVMPETAVQFELDTALTSIQYPDDFERLEDTLFSPSASQDEQPLLVRVNLPFGSLRIQYVE